MSEESYGISEGTFRLVSYVVVAGLSAMYTLAAVIFLMPPD